MGHIYGWASVAHKSRAYLIYLIYFRHALNTALAVLQAHSQPLQLSYEEVFHTFCGQIVAQSDGIASDVSSPIAASGQSGVDLSLESLDRMPGSLSLYPPQVEEQDCRSLAGVQVLCFDPREYVLLSCSGDVVAQLGQYLAVTCTQTMGTSGNASDLVRIERARRLEVKAAQLPLIISQHHLKSNT